MEKMMEKVQIVQPIIKNEGSAGIKKELKKYWLEKKVRYLYLKNEKLFA